MTVCSVLRCTNRSSSVNLHNSGVGFHRFPINPKTKEKWIIATGRGPDWWPSKISTICSDHFEENNFRPLLKSRRLFDWAVPTLKLPTRPTEPLSRHELASKPDNTDTGILKTPTNVIQPIKVMEIDSDIKIESTSHSTTCDHPQNAALLLSEYELALNPDDNDVDMLETSTDVLEPIRMMETDSDIKLVTKSSFITSNSQNVKLSTTMESTSLAETPRKRKMRLQIENYKAAILQKNKKIKALQKKNCRYRKRIADLKDVLKELREKNFVNSDHVSHLQNLGVTDLIERFDKKQTTNKKSKEKYSPELRTFACTLHFYSPKAYQYVRQKFQSCLPHVRTIRRWYESVDSNPGFTKESFEALKQKAANTDYKLLCNLVVDEMAIRQRVEWDGKQMHGYVDICKSGKKGDSLPEANEALVFLVTAINGAFKIPVGYFLVDGVTGEQRANLLIQCLELLQETGVEITSLTFDGCPANMSMAKELGCSFDLDNFKTYFENPSTKNPMYVFPDPCHMLKLLRNAFEANGIFLDDKQRKVKWDDLKQLNALQEKEKLHLANKLRRNHIFFKNQKMKVKLASQLFSNSVADALIFCAELQLPGFENVEGTVDFLKVVNNLFDVLNSRHIAQLHYKKPLCASNKTQIFNFLSIAEEYLLNLKLQDGTRVVSSSRKTGFIGFLTCIKSLKAFYIQIVEKEKKLVYFPAYKISQDHLELLFGQIRIHGGCNTNPTARQFQAIYKKLMVKSELRDVESGNCQALEKVSILTCSSVVKKINATVEARYRDDVTDYDDINDLYEMAIFDQEIEILVQDLSEFSLQTIAYIAGFVVRALMKSLKCETCTSALLASDADDSYTKFIKLKNKGGLVFPSKDVVTICKQMEVIIKSSILAEDRIMISTKNIQQQLMSKALPRFVGMNLFKDYDFHQYDQSPLNNHLIMLMKAVMERYVNIRLHFLTKNAVPKLSKRQVLNKYLHFSGQ